MYQTTRPQFTERCNLEFQSSSHPQFFRPSLIRIIPLDINRESLQRSTVPFLSDCSLRREEGEIWGCFLSHPGPLRTSKCPFSASDVEKEIEISFLYLAECQLKCSGARGEAECPFLVHMAVQYKEINIYQLYQS